MAAVTETTQQQRPPFWRDATILKWAAQLLTFGAVVGLFLWLIGNLLSNLAAQGTAFSWRFLSEPYGVNIAEGIDTTPETAGEALFVGIVNMLRITISGIIAATFLGTLIGIARLSSNWIVNKVGTVYVETIRNIPLLVQILFWSSVAIALPALELDTGPIPGWLYVSAKGVSIAWVFPGAGFWQWMVWLVIGVFAARYVRRWRIHVQEETGHESFADTYAVGTLLLIAVIGYFAHPVFSFLGFLWAALEAVFANFPVVVVQIVLAVAGVAAGVLWIRNFLESRRTPAGLAKLSDDDWFRMGFAGFVGLFGAVIVFVIPGISEVFVDGLHRLFEWLDTRFRVSGTPLRFSRPELATPGAGRFVQYAETGQTMIPPFFAVWVGVTLYTAAFIAEVVRGGILAVSRGQTEAGLAVGLRRSQLLRLIVLPQAFRIILPPMGNQYLNLAKNTSLGIAVGFADIVLVGETLINQTGQSVPVIVLWMAFYLTVSLFLSSIVNWYNRRVQLVER